MNDDGLGRIGLWKVAVSIPAFIRLEELRKIKENLIQDSLTPSRELSSM